MTHTYDIDGMTCGNCAASIKSELLKLPDVLSAEVDLEKKLATVNMQKHISVLELQNAVAHAGWKYKISEHRNGSFQTMKKNGAASHAPEGFGTASTITPVEEELSWLETYKPIVLLFGFITVVSLSVSVSASGFNWMLAMRVFMSGFFLSFSFFKLLDLNAFADSYSTYDIVAKRWRGWGFVYVFVEVSLGILYALNFEPVATNIITLVIMSVSIVGVLQSVLNKNKIQCACLGTVFKFPMSTVTIIEDGLMIVMSAVMIWAMN